MTTTDNDDATRQAHIDIAIDRLSATWEDGDDWSYYAPETSSHWRVTEDDLADLGEALERDDVDAYSLWCAGCGEEVSL